MKNSVFLDTAYSVALSIPGDARHITAVKLAATLKDSQIPIITTQVVILEIGNALSRREYRETAIRLIQGLEADPNTTIIKLTDDLYGLGFELFSSRNDKDWSLIDCISFVVMQEREITEALTTDRHFVQAGFRALLLEG